MQNSELRGQAQRVIMAHFNRDAKLRIPNIKDALALLLSTPNLKAAVEKFYAMGFHKNPKALESIAEENSIIDKSAGTAGMFGIPIALAILAIAGISKAATPEDLLKYIDHNKGSISQRVPDLKGLEESIPFAADKVELFALKTTKPSFEFFKKKLEGKIKGAMSKAVVPYIDSSDSFRGMSNKQIAEYIGDSFISKLKKPQYSEATKVLKEYLSVTGKDINDIKKIAIDTALAYLNSSQN